MERNTKRKTDSSANKKSISRCSPVAASGIRTSKDFASFMSSLMSDVVDGGVTPQVANAACNAGGKLLRVVEMEYRYGNSERVKAVTKSIQLLR